MFETRRRPAQYINDKITHGNTVSHKCLSDGHCTAEDLRELRKLVVECSGSTRTVAEDDEGLNDAGIVDADVLVRAWIAPSATAPRTKANSTHHSGYEEHRDGYAKHAMIPCGSLG